MQDISPKTWTVIIDAVVSLSIILITRYLSPADVQMWTQIIGILQVVLVALLTGQTVVEVKELQNMHEAYMLDRSEEPQVTVSK